MHQMDGRADPRPALLRAADAALAWSEGGFPTCRMRVGRWLSPRCCSSAWALPTSSRRRSGPRGACPYAPDDPGVLRQFRGDTAARLAPDGAARPLVFLHLLDESARCGSRIAVELHTAETAWLACAAGEDKQSRLPATVEPLLRQPEVTARPSPDSSPSPRRRRCGCLRGLRRPAWSGR